MEEIKNSKQNWGKYEGNKKFQKKTVLKNVSDFLAFFQKFQRSDFKFPSMIYQN